MDLVDALRTTGAARRFTDEAVGDDVIVAILDDARFAPSGGNRQPWRVAIVGDRDLRRQLGADMQRVWDEYVAIGATGVTPFSVTAPQPALTAGDVTHSPNVLLDAICDVPVMLAVAADLDQIAMMDAQLDRPALTGGASVYPFCWSILLAARARGLGGVMTTFASRVEPLTGASLGLPDRHALAAVVFLGHVEHTVTRLRRRPVATFATIDRFDGPPFAP
jgi:nitroreductase